MKKSSRKAVQLLKQLLCFVLVFALVVPNTVITQAAETVVTEEELIAKTNPILKSYDVSDSSKLWTVTTGTRFVVEATGTNLNNERLEEVVKLINSEFMEKEIASSSPHAMLYGANGQQTASDIFIRMVDVADITSETESEEAYKITISDKGVTVEGASENAVMYALRTIETMMITNNGLVHGTIVDYPDVAERRLHVDCARKYISKDWFIRQIREMSYLKMNAIQIHFSENLGFRIQCDTDPSIMSDEYLTKAEVKAIIAEANKYGIKVIPSFDSPGHVDQILKAHPEYGQVNSSGEHYASGLDVTNPEAVAYIYSLYDEYMELFEGCTDFHIGGDEYMEFDRAPFTTEYKSVLNAYAAETLGDGYIWKDVLSNYINELAEYVHDHGFTPRIWNDGIYYGESASEGAQKIVMHDYIGIDFWSQMTWNSSIARLQTFIDHGHTTIYNINASYFYYVLRPTMPTDGREQHSFDVLNQDANIYNNWTPGQFQSNTIADDSEVIKGAAIGIWCDKADVCDEDTITEDIASELRALASKSWNTSSNSVLAYDDFVTLTDEIGHAAGFEKGSELPNSGDFAELGELGKVTIKYQDTKGNTLKADDVMYGVLGTNYSYTAPEIYKWLPQNEEASGTFSKTDAEIIFIYDVDPNPVMFDSEMKTYPSVTEYKTTGDKFALGENSRLVVISSDQTLQNETLENDLKLLSSEFTAAGLTDTSMNIVYGTESAAKAGDIVIRIDEATQDSNPEAYEIKIGDYAVVSSTGEAGIFYGIRMIQKTLLLNGKEMDDGVIKDEPSVEVRGFHIDNARKFFTKDWIMKLIKDLSYQNINTLQYHFSENEGFRLESETLEALDGWTYPSDGYFTKEDMLDIIEECNKYHIELVPSMDSPGHMTYVLNYLPDDWDCTALWSESEDWRSVQTFNIFEKEECKAFLVELFTEYAEFFSEAGCKHFNIGGDEFLNNFGRMTNDQYIIVMNYFNEISALVKSYGMTPRAWNDGLLYTGYTGYTLDPDIEICYWSGPSQCATIADFVANGNKVINFTDVYMYFALSSWWMSNANASGQKILTEWTPGKLAGSSVVGDQTCEYPYDDYLLGASYALWCDVPDYMTQDAVASNLYLRTRAMAEKSWNPNSTLSYSSFESIANELGHAPGYDSELPESGDIFYEGELGTVILKFVDTEGNSLRSDRTVYGLVDDTYTIEPDDIYSYRFVSMDKEATGIYTEDEVVITLTYEFYVNKEALRAAVADAKAEKDYIPVTYTEYKAALKDAKAVLANADATQEEVDAALEALLAAENSLIALDRLDLYLEVTYPVGSAGYTSGSYSTYQSAVNAGKSVLMNKAATAEDVANALANILNAKAGLASSDMITVTANQAIYQTYYLSNILDGNTSTYAWIGSAQNLNDYVLFTFATPVVLSSVRIQSPSDAGDDRFHHAVVEISLDGESWTEIGTIEYELDKSFTVDNETVQYVRIRIAEEVKYWTKISEADFVYEAAPVDKSALEAAIADAAALNKDDYSAASWAVLEGAVARGEELLAKDDVTAGEITAAIKAIEASVADLAAPVLENPFEDVFENDYYYNPVLWAVENEITDGTSDTTFSPNQDCTRGHVVTFLWRANGCPEPASTTCEFTDIKESDYYYKAVLWAKEQGITDGTSDTTFSPDQYCNRGQIVTFLWREAKQPQPTATSTKFTDLQNGAYYISAVLWAVENGITDGTSDTTFSPDTICTRGQTVTFLYRSKN